MTLTHATCAVSNEHVKCAEQYGGEYILLFKEKKKEDDKSVTCSPPPSEAHPKEETRPNIYRMCDPEKKGGFKIA